MAVSKSAIAAAPGLGAQALEKLLANVGRVVKGKDGAIELCAVALVAGGHVLLDDIPGVGKTTLARALSRSIHARFQRIQFTADLLPGDVLGVSIWSEARREFEFRAGPVFHEIVLADEINRAGPKTQSALLEAMNEGQVSVDGVTHKLPDLFLVIATQNPQEYAGTFPLPESQLDRFLLSFEMGYPSHEAERQMLSELKGRGDVEEIPAVLSAQEILGLQRDAAAVRVDPSLVDYIQRLVQRTRRHELLSSGVSPRGALALRRAAQARAVLHGRNYAIPDDFKSLAVSVFAHRVRFSQRAGAGLPPRAAAREVIAQILRETPVPA